MSKGTLDRMAVRYFQTAVQDLKVETTESGAQIIRAMSVFRTGTFKDSWGDPHTWESEHLEQMVFNYSMLKNRNILPNVPVRDGHPGLFGSGGEVVGYIADLYTINGAAYEDGYTRLVADLEITEPDAYGKIERGTWRGRSAEIGFYETNDETMYWPVFMGLAWVDIPAVEGLFSKQQDGGNKFTFIRDNDQEGAVAGASKQTQNHNTPGTPGSGSPAGAQNPAGDGSGQQGTGTETPPAGTEGDNDNEGQKEGAPTGTPDPEGDNESGTDGPPAGTTQHASHNRVHTFRINGVETQDFGQVQSHIDALESAIGEQAETNRREFVTSLANRNLIPATQVDSMTEHALSLTDEQWQAFTKMYPEDTAPAALFQNHGTNGSESDPSGNNGPSEVDTLRETVTMHRKSGMPDAKVKETKSYKRLMELTDGKG